MNIDLLGLLEIVLGAGKKTSGNNYAFYCPVCNHRKKKLEANLSTYKFNCWVCNFKGTSIVSLFRKLKVEEGLIKKAIELTNYTSKIFTEETNSDSIFLPTNFISLIKKGNTPEYNHAISYLYKRGITKIDIIKYNIGYCETGEYKNMLIIPSYDANQNLNYFIARSFYKDSNIKYINPKISRDVICFELFIDWNQDIILTEGVFDAMSIKRNCIPLLGKYVLPELKNKLLQKEVSNVYICLDSDALNESLNIAKYLIANGKIAYVVELGDQDPSNMGYRDITDLIRKTKPITFNKLMALKLGKK